MSKEPLENLFVSTDYISTKDEEIVKEGFEKLLAEQVTNMVDRSEYKRRQAPPGIKITPKAFGRDRRLPITNRFRA